ncbi:MAG: type II secretion system secretin GspD [Sedimentisphaerales bacterium]|nr:type II secretion system secretin GspD [Sedimentisphaerales bacterium]
MNRTRHPRVALPTIGCIRHLVRHIVRLAVCGAVGLLAWLAGGCQPEAVPRTPASSYQVKVSAEGQVRTIDAETAAMLKRHSVLRRFGSTSPQAGPAEALAEGHPGRPDPSPAPTADRHRPEPNDPSMHPAFAQNNPSYAPPANLNEPAATETALTAPVAIETGDVTTSGADGPATGDESTAAAGADLADAEPTIDPLPSESSLPACLQALADSDLADKPISLNFEQADIRSVLKTISELTGIQFILADEISGTITVLSPSQMKLKEVYGFLQSILYVKGLAAIAADDHVKIVPSSQAHQHRLPIRVGCDPDRIAQTDAIYTQIMPLKYADAAEVGGILKPHLSATGQLDTYSRTNTLIVTDSSAMIHQAALILRQLDVPGAKEEVTVIPLQFASASVLAKQITEIMERDASAAGAPRRPPALAAGQTRLQIQADARINALVVTANRQDTQTIAQLVRQLDVEQPVGVNNVQVVYLKNAKAKEVAESLTSSLSQLQNASNQAGPVTIHVNPDVGTNSLIIQASPPDFKVIAQLIEKLDIVREQVLVELLIMEVSQDALTEIGVDWATLDQAVSDSVRYFGGTNFGVRVDYLNGDLRGLGVGAYKNVGGDVRIASIVGALQKETGANILSTPHVLTSNHQTAEILVGDNIPYVTQSRITETDPSTPTVIKTIEYKDVGVNMNITPHVNQGGMVRLEIESEFSQLVESATGLSDDTPTTATRKLKTEIAMMEGRTIVIGGLIRDDKITVEEKVPLLGDLPLLGQLFRFNRDRLQKTNLLLFITPYVLTSQDELALMSEKKQAETAAELADRIKDPSGGQQDGSSFWQ